MSHWRDTHHKMAALILALVLFLLTNAFVSAWALYSRFESTNRNRVANGRIWHAVICDIEAAVIKEDGKLSAKQRAATLRFYDTLLVKDAHAAPCGLYPGGKQ